MGVLFLKVSQGGATEKLAYQVAAPAAAAHRWAEEAPGDPHEEEEDETHQGRQGHLSGKYAFCSADPEGIAAAGSAGNSGPEGTTSDVDASWRSFCCF